MRLRALLVAGTVFSAGMIATEGAWAQAPALWSVQSRDNWVERNFATTPKRIVYTSARSLGMLRGLMEQNLFVRLRYKGAGTAWTPDKSGAWTAVPLSNYYADVSYPDDGMRVDVTSAAGRQVHVVAGAVAWDEVGVTADGPAAGASQKLTPEALKARQHALALTPYGAIDAAHNVIDKVKVTNAGHGVFVLTFPYDGETMKVTLDRNRRPARVELPFVHPVIGKTTMVAEYSDYKDYEPLSPLSDEPFSFLQFPAHIVHKLGAKTTLDVKIDTCWCTNPYVVFAKPGEAPPPPRTARGPASPATPRTADGHPELSGMWRAGGGGGEEGGGGGVGRAFVNRTEEDDEGGAKTKSAIREGNYNYEEVDAEYIVKAGQDMPIYKPEMWEEIRSLEENAYRRPADPQYGCKNQGLVRLGAPLESFLLPNKFTTLYSPGMAIPWIREVALDGRALPKPENYEGVKPVGTSVGHWEGDTLVVDSVDFPPGGGVWYSTRGWIGDAETKITERYHRDGDRLFYDITVDDPQFVRPWVRPTVTLSLDKNGMFQQPLTCIEYDGDQLPPSSD